MTGQSKRAAATDSAELSPPAAPVGPSLIAAALTGAVAGCLGSLLIAPRVIGWWYEPSGREAISCALPVREALSTFVWAQVVTTLLLTVVFLIGAAMIRNKRRGGL